MNGPITNTVGITEHDIARGWAAIAKEAGLDPNWKPPKDGSMPRADLGNEVIEKPSIPTEKFLAPALGKVCDAAAPNWKFTDKEIEELAGVYAPLIDKYVPGGWPAFLAKWEKEIMAVYTTYAIFSLRSGVPLRVKEGESEEKPDQEEAATETPAPAGVPDYLEGLEIAA